MQTDTTPQMQFGFSKAPVAPPLSDYLDYRLYLKDFYQYKRELTKNSLRPYSYAVFATGADIKSPNYMKLIIDAERNLSDDMILKFAKALAFNKEQTEEFKILVHFSQTQDTAERNIFLKALNDLRVKRQIKNGELSSKAFDKIPNWVAWVVFAMMDQEGIDFRIDSLFETLRGKASREEIMLALKSLIECGEVVIGDDGALIRARQMTENSEEIPAALIRKLQTELMYLGLESLYRDNPVERELGTATLSLTHEEFEELRFQLRKMRKNVQKEIGVKRMTSKGERVYQLNLQLYPITDKTSKKTV